MSTAAQSICRTCRKKQKLANRVPADTVDELNGKTIADMIYDLSDIMVTYDGHLPQTICPECLLELRAAYSFREKCIESNAILNEMFSLSGTTQTDPLKIKQEYEMQESMMHLKPETSDTDTMMSMEEDDGGYNLLEYDAEKYAEASALAAAGTSRSSKRPRLKRSFTSIVMDYVKLIDNRYCCAIDELSSCNYRQTVYNLGNFARHMRSKHPQHAKERGLMRERDEEIVAATPEKPIRAIAKRGVAIDVQVLALAGIKLVAIHDLPVNFHEWDGFQTLLKPLIESVGGVNVYSSMVKHISLAAERINDRIRKDLSKKMVSIKLDFASRRGRNTLTVSTQFEQFHKVVSLTLGTIEVDKDSTGPQLKAKILNVLRSYELSNDQIFAMIVDNTSNTIATAAKLRKAFSDTTISNLDEDSDSADLDKEEELLEALSEELRNEFSVVRGPVNNLQLSMNEALPDADPNIVRIQEFVQKVRNDRYKAFFELKKAKYPPLWSKNRWSGKFKMIRSIVKQEKFFTALCQKHSELALDWPFLQAYNEAFHPLHSIVKQLQKEGQRLPFSEFYMQWMLAIKDLRSKTSNRFSKPLGESLTRRLIALKENMVLKAALYLDPRFNYANTVVFPVDQREEIQNYIVNMWNRISGEPSSAVKVEDSKPTTSTKTDDLDDFITEMFGGSLEASSSVDETVKPVLKQLKSLELERRRPPSHDVWNHWLQREVSHPELFAVAMVLLTIPSNSISLQQAFGALMMTGHQGDERGSEPTREDLLSIKLNRELFDKLAHSLYDWKQFGVKEG